ncbi:MAG: HD domain-containing protein [Campylobacteraceae bacterium]|nr:HD domain-containing protein [Campylobacteraceae bacterium]
MIKFYKPENKNKKEFKDSWKVLIVDDEKDVHSLTRTVLRDLEYEDKNIIFSSAYSGKEALEILKKENDFAVILLDVIMETDDAGLVFASKLRNELQNHTTRIILRTGQTGDVPIKDVIIKYDINDYKEKTQLNTSNLYISVLLALRSYRDIKLIINKNIYLKEIIYFTKELNKQKDINTFTNILISSLNSLLFLDKNNIKEYIYTYDINDNSINILNDSDFILTKEKEIIINKLIDNNEFLYKNNSMIFILALDNFYLVIDLENIKNENKMNKTFIRMFLDTARVILNNLYTNKRILKEQEELLSIINKLIKRKSNPISSHLNRVSKIVYVIAKAYGLSDDDAKELELASSMHDIGKIDLDENLLNNKNINKEEELLIQKHTQIGYNLLKYSSTSLLKQAAIIAYEHHESWDGSGYPRRLEKEEIHLYSRITAIADFYDSLRIPRSSEKEWPLYDAINFLKKNRNILFEASLVDILIDNIKEIEKIIEQS